MIAFATFYLLTLQRNAFVHCNGLSSTFFKYPSKLLGTAKLSKVNFFKFYEGKGGNVFSSAGCKYLQNLCTYLKIFPDFKTKLYSLMPGCDKKVTHT